MHNLNYYATHPGNLMNSIFALEKELKKQGVGTVYVFPEQAAERYWVKEMIAQGATVYFKKMGKFQPGFFRRIIYKHDVRIIHTHFWDLPTCLTFRWIRLYKKHLKTVIHFHNPYPNSENRLKEIIKRFVLKSDAYIGCGKGIANELKCQSFKNVFCVENAIDFSRLDTYTPVDKSALGIGKEQKMFLIFGHDFHRKGADLAIDVLHDISKTNDVVLAMPLSENAPSIQKIRDTFGEIPAFIKILPPTNEIAAYYNAADVFLSPSRSEGFCYAVLEAVYCGCYTIISNIDGHATDIPQIATCVCDDKISLKKQIIAIIEKEPDSNIILRQKEYVEEQYSLKKWVDIVKKIYEQL
jgi:glycosyltransferase involved in cell wall biosynthesis